MAIILIIAGIWLVGHIFNYWGPPPPSRTPGEIFQEQQAHEQRQRDQKAEFEQKRAERKKAEAEKREQWTSAWRSAYGEYLKSDKWQRVRQRVFKRANHICEYCGGPAQQVHHEHYPKNFRRLDFRRENMSFLKAVCRNCHREQHGL